MALSSNTSPPGLSGVEREQWPEFTEADAKLRPIDRLDPDSTLHGELLTYLTTRLEMSERAMGCFYDRWRANEKRVQAYIDLPDFEKVLDEMNSKGKAPQVVSITIPYSFATISAIVTFLLHTFTGRKPMFQVGTNKTEYMEAAEQMEIVLQYNADHTRLIRELFQFLQDSMVYGVNVLRTNWKEERKLRTVWKTEPKVAFGMKVPLTGKSTKRREYRLTYMGNEVESHDPFLFFPDPRVPMSKVNRKGEFVFWRSFTGRHELKKVEAAGGVKWVDNATTTMPASDAGGSTDSNRSLRAQGESMPGALGSGDRMMANYVQLDQGTVEIIPAELGLGEEERPQKWIFTIANKSQIIQAEPYDVDHDMHPVCVSEPLTFGYGFGHLGMADYLGPIQDTISWLVTSHIQNVRTVLNDMIVYNPMLVEEQDLKDPEPGKLIRLKQAAFGVDVRTAVHQLKVTDVTGQHVKDADLMMNLGERISSISDNLQGIQAPGGRKTATEVRTSSEAGGSRLAMLARLISAQAVVDLTEQMSLNTQQYLTDSFYLQIVGKDGVNTSVHVSPESLVGDFHFPVHDGTLPLDRVAMLDIWKEILVAVMTDPGLRATYSIPRIFEFVAELGGARNIESMRIKTKVKPDEEVQAGAQAGNLIPVPRPGGDQVSGLGAPGQRLSGAL